MKILEKKTIKLKLVQEVLKRKLPDLLETDSLLAPVSLTPSKNDDTLELVVSQPSAQKNLPESPKAD